MPKVLIVNDAGDSNVSAPHFDDATQVVETDSTGNAIELLADQDFDALYVCDSKQGNQRSSGFFKVIRSWIAYRSVSRCWILKNGSCEPIAVCWKP